MSELAHASGVVDFTLTAGGLIGAFLAALGLAAGARTLYRRTLGRRRDYSQRLARLGTNAQLSFFTAVIGEPPAMKRTVSARLMVDPAEVRADEAIVTRNPDLGLVEVERKLRQCIWIDREFYAAGLVDEDETVVLFSVTSRNARFHPEFTSGPPGSVPRLAVRLGKTRLADLSTEPERVISWLGARRFVYGEVYYLGNPGHYQHFACSVNDVGLPLPSSPGQLFDMETGPWEIDMRGLPDGDKASERVRTYRKLAVINTWTVVGPSPTFADHAPGSIPLLFGVDQDQVRTLR